MGLERWLCNSIHCSYRGLEFHFEPPLGSWQPPVTPAPPAGLHQHQACTHTESKHSNSNLFLKHKLNIIGRGTLDTARSTVPFNTLNKPTFLQRKKKSYNPNYSVVLNFKRWKNSMLKIKNNNSLIGSKVMSAFSMLSPFLKDIQAHDLWLKLGMKILLKQAVH